jgi:hypothetical protein
MSPEFSERGDDKAILIYLEAVKMPRVSFPLHPDPVKDLKAVGGYFEYLVRACRYYEKSSIEPDYIVNVADLREDQTLNSSFVVNDHMERCVNRILNTSENPSFIKTDSGGVYPIDEGWNIVMDTDQSSAVWA